ncbi:methyltransferase domain-containing protein [Embleya sp. NPDC050493]|uniref:methyltransferase domain-containing protein n=1 Tax=Embleya sp. NPDC050493 TaxID=3363989 RepID=UPI00378EDB39
MPRGVGGVAAFDVCHSFEAVCHVPDKWRVHDEAFRILEPGGRHVGYDWFAAEGLTDVEHERFIEPIPLREPRPAAHDLPRAAHRRSEHRRFRGAPRR